MILLISKGEMGLAPFTFKLKLGKSCLAIPCMHGGSKMAVWGSQLDFNGSVTPEHRGNSSSRCSTSLLIGRHGLGQM